MIITYGGVDITKYLRPTRQLDRKILPEVDYQMEQVGNSDGLKFRRAVYGKRLVEMPFQITNELIKNRRELARVLSTREPLQLIFGDEPLRFWLAVPTGDISVDEMVFLGKGVITWIVPDGMAHDVNTRVFTNTTTAPTAKNQVLDPEFNRSNKFLKAWVARQFETNGSSNIVRGDFTSATIADQGEYKFEGFHIFQNGISTGRYFPALKQGDRVSAQVQVRINTAAPGDTTGDKSAVLGIQELDNVGGRVIKTHAIYPTALNPGVFTNLTMVGLSVSSSETKALNLITGVADGASIDISRPQFNLGATLEPFTVTSATYSEFVAVTNPGTYRAWPIIRATMNGENGLVGIINQNEGVLQFGDTEAIDTLPGIRSDKVIWLQLINDADKIELNKGFPTYPNYVSDPSRPNLKNGSLDWLSDYNSVQPVYLPNPVLVWGGPTLYTDIPKNHANKANGDFRYLSRFTFLSSVRAMGRFTVSLQSGDTPVLSCVLRDSSETSNDLTLEFKVGETLVKIMTFDRKIWFGTFWQFGITRTNGTNIEFSFSQILNLVGEEINAPLKFTFNLVVPELANTDITGLVTWFQKFQNVEAAKMSWTDCKFFWINENVITDIPNLFDDNDLLEIDTYNRRVKLNGVENNFLHALGNRWESFAIEPGTTTLLPVASTWASMYDLQVELRGAYI